MAKEIRDIVFTEKVEGRDKPNYHKVGILVIDGDKVSIKLNSIPVGNWNGWLNAYAQREKNSSEQTGKEPF